MQFKRDADADADADDDDLNNTLVYIIIAAFVTTVAMVKMENMVNGKW